MKKSDTSSIDMVTSAIIESISDGLFTVDCDWRITSFNRAAVEITGISKKEALGQPCCEVFRSSMCGDECPLRKTMKTGRPIIGKAGYIIAADGERIPISVSTAVLRNDAGSVIGGAETFRDLSEIHELRKELDKRSHVGDLHSHSHVMQQIFEVIPAIAASPSTVLVTGETGTGKELVARAIHGLSPQSKGPFIAVNCGALPDSLLESELFGYKAGAFTGAIKDKPGRFALAAGGTIFLDEIGEISPALQVRLLRVLQERVYEPLGGTKPLRTNARFVVATNRNLREQVNTGKFREDLFYRINVVHIKLPPLRQRKEDIPMLTDDFIRSFNRQQKKSIKGVAHEVLDLLMAHDWPGNIRELENVIEHAFILCDHGTINLKHLPANFLRANARAAIKTDIRSVRDTLDAQTIRLAVERHCGNRAAAARELGIHKTTLFRKIKRLAIELPETDGRSHRNS